MISVIKTHILFISSNTFQFVTLCDIEPMQYHNVFSLRPVILKPVMLYLTNGRHSLTPVYGDIASDSGR